jgi:hypothetical protein
MNASNHYRNTNPMTSMQLYEALDEIWDHGTIMDWSPQ